MIATSERVGGRGRVRCCVALALGLACDRSGGAAIDAPAQAAPTGAADPSALETPVDAAVPATPRRPTSTGWTVEHDELGTLRIRNRNADVVRTSYAFFEAGYRWADTDIRLTRTSGDADAIDAIEAALEIAALGVRGTSRLTLEQTETTATATLRWQLSLSRHVVDVSGGGLDLRGALVPALWGGKAPVADVSADGRQLTVGRGDSALRFELDGDAAAFSMLPGMPGVVRLVLLAGTIERGTRQVTMRVTLPAGGQIATASAARHPVPGPSWSGPALVHDAWPVDLSFLQDAPAGKHGHVRADGESLVFADGTPARFWGTNLSAYALFERDKAAIARQARRISAMGFNLVRLHHHDSGWVTPNISGSAAGPVTARDGSPVCATASRAIAPVPRTASPVLADVVAPEPAVPATGRRPAPSPATSSRTSCIARSPSKLVSRSASSFSCAAAGSRAGASSSTVADATTIARPPSVTCDLRSR